MFKYKNKETEEIISKRFPIKNAEKRGFELVKDKKKEISKKKETSKK